MTNRQSSAWQIILADIALILFLTTLAAFAAQRSSRDATQSVYAQLAAPQAIYRRSMDTSLAQWIAEQQPDDRFTFTIFARYAPGAHEPVWQEVQWLLDDAKQAGIVPRVVFEAGQERDVYVALAYDGVFKGYSTD